MILKAFIYKISKIFNSSFQRKVDYWCLAVLKISKSKKKELYLIISIFVLFDPFYLNNMRSFKFKLYPLLAYFKYTLLFHIFWEN